MFTYRGRIEPGSKRHSPKGRTNTGGLIAPQYAYNAWTNKPDIPQYAPTVAGSVRGYAPGDDCQGAFMPYKHIADNNCYAYACCIATNTFPQPGRASRGSVELDKYHLTAVNVQENAQLDGLIPVGNQMPDPRDPPGPGHLVALLFSAPVSKIGGDPLANWPGDYHWVRCDDAVHHAKWSQKDGWGQVTDYDFAGQPITDPRSANWRVNYGPIGKPPEGGPDDLNEFVVSYDFVCFMWVPDGANII